MTTGKRVAIVGAALSDCGRVDDKDVYELHYQGASRAIADAGLTKADIGGFMSCGTGTLAPVEVAEYLGLRPDWIDSTQVGGGRWEIMGEHALSSSSAEPIWPGRLMVPPSSTFPGDTPLSPNMRWLHGVTCTSSAPPSNS